MFNVTVTHDEQTTEVYLNPEHVVSLEPTDDGRVLIVMLNAVMHPANEPMQMVLSRISEARRASRR